MYIKRPCIVQSFQLNSLCSLFLLEFQQPYIYMVLHAPWFFLSQDICTCTSLGPEQFPSSLHLLTASSFPAQVYLFRKEMGASDYITVYAICANEIIFTVFITYIAFILIILLICVMAFSLYVEHVLIFAHYCRPLI